MNFVGNISNSLLNAISSWLSHSYSASVTFKLSWRGACVTCLSLSNRTSSKILRGFFARLFLFLISFLFCLVSCSLFFIRGGREGEWKCQLVAEECKSLLKVSLNDWNGAWNIWHISTGYCYLLLFFIRQPDAKPVRMPADASAFRPRPNL